MATRGNSSPRNRRRVKSAEKSGINSVKVMTRKTLMDDIKGGDGDGRFRVSAHDT
jgi:hypothetical protein